MVKILAAHIGSYPRIGEEKDQQRHRRSQSHFDAGFISAHAFHDVEQSVVQEIVREQISAGLDEVTDGLISWRDPISHLCKNIAGIKSAGLTRYFDTNFYYRVPVFTSKPKPKGSAILSDFRYAQSISNKPVRVVLTGPYTLARHTQSELKSFSKLASRVEFFTEVLQSEIAALIREGAQLIQFDEPSLARHPEDFSLFAKTLQKLTEKSSSARFILALYFSPLAPLADKLLSLPVHALNLDFTNDGKKLFEKLLSANVDKIIGFGFLNARSVKMEPVDPPLKWIRQWVEQSRPSLVYITPSCGLEFLPRDTALAKLKLLGKIRDEIHAWASREVTHA